MSIVWEVYRQMAELVTHGQEPDVIELSVAVYMELHDALLMPYGALDSCCGLPVRVTLDCPGVRVVASGGPGGPPDQEG